jgi:hypothetical protein
MRSLACTTFALLAACGATPSAAAVDASPSTIADAAVAPSWPLLETPGFSAARLAVAPARVLILEERLTGFDVPAPGPRRVRAIDRSSFAERSWAPDATSRIADIALHASGKLSLAVVDESHAIAIVTLDEELRPVSDTSLVDPQAALDPIAGGPADADLRASTATADSVRIATVGEDVAVTVFTSRNSVVAYRLHLVDGVWATTWRALVEPAVGLTPFLPIGGSFDTFGAIVAWYRPALATDSHGDSYVAVWMGQRRFEAHGLVFGDGLQPVGSEAGFDDSDVVVTKIDPSGARLWSRAIGTAHEDEPYALAAEDERVVVVGRTRREPGFDNTQWNPWLAIVTADGKGAVNRTLAFDPSAILLAVAPDRDRIVVAGSDGWSQNPDGLSVFTFGHKLAAMVDGAGGSVRLPLPPGPRQNEIRSVLVTSEGIWFAGHEDGPLTHSGDGDPAEIRATGVVGLVPR